MSTRAEVAPLSLPRASAWRRWLVREATPLVAALDAVVIAAVLLGCYAGRFVLGWLPPSAPPPPFAPYAAAAAVLAVVWTGCLAWVGLYRTNRTPSRFDDAVLLLAGLSLGLGLTLAASFFYRGFSFSRLVALYAFGTSLALLFAGHWAARTWQQGALARGWGCRPTLVLGDNPLGRALAARLAAQPGHRLVGVVALEDGGPREAGAALQPDTVSALDALIAAHGVERLVLAWPEAPASALAERLLSLAARWPALEVSLAPDQAGLVTARLAPGSLDGLPVLALREVPLQRWPNRLLKRTMDLGLAALGLLLAAPLMALVAALVWREGRGPVLYVQERLGRDGRPFSLYKFRTMPVDAEPDGPVWARRGDARATPLGAVLRRHSLDELPQLWNVLRGEMSLVGPRPERPHFVARFRTQVPDYMDRHLVRCGLTGWAQVNGLRGDVSIEERTRHDLWYVENWSLLLDLRILLMTAAVILRRPAD